ncbi:MAG: hypothetical protein V3V97_19325 [Hyphomicrobiaceae bacterium]
MSILKDTFLVISLVLTLIASCGGSVFLLVEICDLILDLAAGQNLSLFELTAEAQTSRERNL